MAALAGIVYLTVSGRRMRVVGEATYKLSGRKRETLTGQDNVHGFKEMPIAGRIAATVRADGDLSMATVKAWTDETAVLELANGKVVVGRNMWTVEEQEVNTEEGTFPLVLEGPDVTEN
jgi:hypothetical protein